MCICNNFHTIGTFTGGTFLLRLPEFFRIHLKTFISLQMSLWCLFCTLVIWLKVYVSSSSLGSLNSPVLVSSVRQLRCGDWALGYHGPELWNSHPQYLTEEDLTYKKASFKVPSLKQLLISHWNILVLFTSVSAGFCFLAEMFVIYCFDLPSLSKPFGLLF